MIALSQSTPPYCHRSLYPNIERAQECVTVAIVVVTGAFVAGASRLFLYEIDAAKFNLRPLSCGAWDLHVRVQIPLLLRHKKLCKKTFRILLPSRQLCDAFKTATMAHRG